MANGKIFYNNDGRQVGKNEFEIKTYALPNNPNNNGFSKSLDTCVDYYLYTDPKKPSYAGVSNVGVAFNGVVQMSLNMRMLIGLTVDGYYYDLPFEVYNNFNLFIIIGSLNYREYYIAINKSSDNIYYTAKYNIYVKSVILHYV